MKKYLKIVGKIVGYGGIFFIVPYIINIIFRLLGEEISRPVAQLLQDTPSTGFGMISLCSLILYFLISKIRRKSFTEDFHLKKLDKQSGIDSILIAALMGVFSMCLVSTNYVSQNFTDLMETMKFFYLQGSVIPIILSAVLIGPAFEEFLFRGIIFKELNKGMHFVPALIIQTMLYSLVQPNFQAGVYGFIGGIAFAWVYLCSRSLWTSIIVQTASCFFMFIYIRFNLYSALTNLHDVILLIGSLLSGIAIVIVLIKMFKRSKKEGMFKTKFEEEKSIA